MDRTGKTVRILGIMVTICAITISIVCFTVEKQTVNFEMMLCSTTGDVASFSIDAVLKSSLIAPREYVGTLYFNGMEYVAHQNIQRASELSVILDRFKDRLNDVTYAIFFRTGVYGVSDRVMIEDVLCDDEKDTYMIWLYYHEAGMPKSEEYFGPAQSAEEAEKIRDAFSKHYLDGK